MASIRKRGNKYYIDYRLHGKRVRKSAGTSAGEANQLLQQIQQEINLSKSQSLDGGMSFSKLAEEFLARCDDLHAKNTCDRYRVILANFSQFLNSRTDSIKYINKITPGILSEYQSQRIQADVKPRTVNSELVLLKKVFQMAIKSGKLLKNPAEDISKLEVEKTLNLRYLTPDECGQLLAVSDDYTYILILILLLIGINKIELENLTWDQVDFERREVRLALSSPTNSSNEFRIIPLHDQALKILEQLKATAGDRQLVMVDRKGRPLSKNYVRNEIVKAATKCGLVDVTNVNVFRNTFIAQLIKNGVDITTIKRIMGGASERVDGIAQLLLESTPHEAINKLDFGSVFNQPKDQE